MCEPTPYDALPKAIQAQLIDDYCNAPDYGDPKYVVCDWMAERFFRTLTDENLNRWLGA